MIKAAFIAVAKDLTGNRDADGNVITQLFDSRQGWGRMLVTPVLAPLQAVEYFDQAEVFTATGQSWTQHVVADDLDQPMRIMLTWTDAPGHGLGGTAPAWNNDLDLRVHGAGNTWLGNVFSGGWSNTGGAADPRHNMEGVFLQPGQHGGSVEIEVFAADLNSDGVPHLDGDTDQDFALVCYNCRFAAPSVDLAIQASSSPAVALPGEPLGLDIIIDNLGPDPATQVSVVLMLDPATTGTHAPEGDWACNGLGLRMMCRSDQAVHAGDSLALSLVTHTDADARDPLVWQIEVRADEPDADVDSNHLTLVVPVDDDSIFSDDFERSMPSVEAGG